jgi:hypothetical protein
MYFITLVRFRKKLTQEDFKAFDEAEKEIAIIKNWKNNGLSNLKR